MALLPFGPIHVVAVRALPVPERVRVAGRLWGLVLHRRRRRRSLYRGHGRARRLTVRAAARVMARLVGIIDAVAVLGAVHNSHVVVADAALVLAVFIIPCSSAVLHLGCGAIARRMSRELIALGLSARGGGEVLETRCVWLTGVLARFCDLAVEQEVAAMTCVATSASATG